MMLLIARKMIISLQEVAWYRANIVRGLKILALVIGIFVLMLAVGLVLLAIAMIIEVYKIE
jgi:hypothetical protein